MKKLERKNIVSYSLVGIFIISLMIGSQWLSQLSGQLANSLSSEIIEIADNSGMSARGKQIFYAAHPEIVDGEVLYQRCPAAREPMAAGCALTYTSDINNDGVVEKTDKIYLRRFGDSDATVRYRIVVHEMLHVAYSRLSEEEKGAVDSLVYEEFKRKFSDAALRVIIDPTKIDSHARNELHSVFGAEYRTLSPELESYYEQFLRDRDALFVIHQENELEHLFRQATELNGKMLYLEIVLSQMNDQMVVKKNEGDYEMFNVMVGEYNAVADRHNLLVQEHRSVREQAVLLLEAQ